MPQIEVFKVIWPNDEEVTVVRTPYHSIYIFPDGQESVYAFGDNVDE